MMETLPDDVLLMIFERLQPWELVSTAPRVCRRWAGLLAPLAVAAARREELGGLRRATRVLRVTTRALPFRDFLRLTPATAPNLRALIVYIRHPFTVEQLSILKQLPHLEHLDIFFRDEVINVYAVPYIKELKSFVINETVSMRVLRSLTESKHLQSLYMYGRSLYYPRTELLKFVRARKCHLQELTLRCTDLNDAAYDVIGNCANLTSLQLYSCWLMTGKGALHITRLRKLHRLHVTGTRLMYSQSMTSFIEHLPPLIEELDLSMTIFSEEHIAPLVHSLPRLRVLELWVSQLKPTSIVKLAECFSALTVLDINMRLSNSQVLELDKHPSLVLLRCITEYCKSIEPIHSRPPEPVDVRKLVKNIQVLLISERYAEKYFRGNGDGYRGTLFYHWTQGVRLKPLPDGVYDDEELF